MDIERTPLLAGVLSDDLDSVALVAVHVVVRWEGLLVSWQSGAEPEA